MKQIFLSLVAFLLINSIFSCKKETSEKQETTTSTTITQKGKTVDESTFADVAKAKITHLNWNVTADFDQKKLKGFAEYDIVVNDSDKIIFDTNDDLQIDSVTLDNGSKAEFNLGENNESLGKPLTINILPETKKVKIYYQTSPQASALQWLDPAQTAGKKHPYLLTQGQAILTRSYIPIQDTPSIRITYDATVRVPQGLMAVMSAKNPTEKNTTGEYSFQMKQPIPPYLIALAIGDLAYKAIDERSGVYAEPSVLEKAHNELSLTGEMIDKAEQLYGAYPWEQYDILILPPSFPFGGMENPRLTFATPTILAGDKSLTNLVAHELAHSWSGNLVTNATWNDFWLNEGFTVYFERRIMEEMEGKEYAKMLDVIGYQDLEGTIKDFGNDDKYTSLYVNLSGANPDDAFSDVPYEKGYLFLKFLEEKYGRENFDTFLKNYFKKYEFSTMTTDTFIADLKENLAKGQNVDYIEEWIYKTGMPPVEAPVSERFAKVDKAFEVLENSPADIDSIKTADWTTYEWLKFLRKIPSDFGEDNMAYLDKKFNFTNSGNSEIQAIWFQKAIENKYEAAYPNLTNFLIEVGRRKFLTPLYTAMVESGQKDMALEIYKKARPNYHSVSYNTIDDVLDYDEDK